MGPPRLRCWARPATPRSSCGASSERIQPSRRLSEAWTTRRRWHGCRRSSPCCPQRLVKHLTPRHLTSEHLTPRHLTSERLTPLHLTSACLMQEPMTPEPTFRAHAPNEPATLEHLARPERQAREQVEGQAAGRSQAMDPETRRKAEEFGARLSKYKDQFTAAMDDDFNTADAISALFDLVRDANASLGPDAPAEVAAEALSLLRELGGVLGLMGRAGGLNDLSDEIQSLIDQRQAARARRDWKESDRIRDALVAKGLILEDTPSGVRWKKKV